MLADCQVHYFDFTRRTGTDQWPGRNRHNRSDRFARRIRCKQFDQGTAAH
jgi:hypothetical protein